MTDSEPRKAAGKRERLIEGAAELIHRQGVQASTLAAIATKADVPPGNVYYYFKTRDELVAAVVGSWERRFRELLGSLEADPDPAARLQALAGSWERESETVAAHGCPLGSLCLELGKAEDGSELDAGRLFQLVLEWAEAQFALLGVPEPRTQATTLLAGVQGAALLADTFDDPAIMSSQVHRLQQWIAELAPAS